MTSRAWRRIVRSLSTMPPQSAAPYQAYKTLGAFALIMVAWALVWIAKSYLDAAFAWTGDDSATALFWLAAKSVVWIVPACWLIHASGHDLKSQFNLKEWRRWTFWGTAVGLLVALTGLVPKMLAGSALFSHALDYGTLNVLIVAPLFEEFLIRAAVLGSLVRALGFWRANVVAAVCFVVLHIPGWYMAGSLSKNLGQPVGRALSIFILGLCFGWATRKGGSFLAGSVAHCLNNWAV